MRISDWSSDVCSSDLLKKRISENTLNGALKRMGYQERLTGHGIRGTMSTALNEIGCPKVWVDAQLSHVDPNKRSEEHTSELQSLMRISYAVFCLKKKNRKSSKYKQNKNTTSKNKVRQEP